MSREISICLARSRYVSRDLDMSREISISVFWASCVFTHAVSATVPRLDFTLENLYFSS